MTDTSSLGAAGNGTAPSAKTDLPTKAADTVELLVAALNDRAVRPVLIGARALVFGVLIAALGLALTVWLSVGFIRLLDVYAWPGKVWASYLLLGAVFCAVGLVVWHFRQNRNAGATANS
jgi:hypothetical protein